MIPSELPNYLPQRLPCYVFDVDNTISCSDHREHFLKGYKKDWDAFHSACVFDSPIKPTIKVLNALSYNTAIVLLTGRNEKYRKQTENWLKTQSIVPDCLLMRKDDDFRPDWQVKSDVFDDIEKNFKILGAFDDNKEVLRMLNLRGIFTFDCSQK